MVYGVYPVTRLLQRFLIHPDEDLVNTVSGRWVYKVVFGDFYNPLYFCGLA